MFLFRLCFAVAVFARLDVASCASRLQREVATPVAGKIVGAIVANSAVNGVTRRGAVSGAVVRFSITALLLPLPSLLLLRCWGPPNHHELWDPCCEVVSFPEAPGTEH